MKKRIYLTLMVAFLFGICMSMAQNNSIGIMAKYDDEAIKLKVIPKDAHHWLLGIENGYVISRRILGSESNFSPIHKDVLKPAIESEWPQDDRGKEMFAFHIQAIEKIRNMRSEGPFLASLKLAERANENYKMYAFITMRDKVFGDFTGLEFIDHDVQKGILYEYQVAIASTEITSTSIIFDAHDIIESPSLTASSSEKAVRLSWIHDESSPVIGYYLERSDTGFGYERINDGPILPNKNNNNDTLDLNRVFEVLQVDSLFRNYQPFYYRLVALDIWGDELTPCNPIVSMGKDLTPPRLGDFDLKADTVKGSIVISWEPSTDTDLASYFITRSYILNGMDSVIIQNIHPDQALSYEMTNPIEMQNHHFKIGAIDTSGNVSISESKAIFIADKSPPTKINEISFIVDSTGLVQLSWTPSFDSNLKGYWVYRSFAKDGDFIKITDTVLTQEALIDTCSTALLNFKRYYYLEALDKSFNRSEPSKIIEVKLPDTIPPSITTISSIVQEELGLKIYWNENQSEDVKSYLIYRRTIGAEWTLLKEVQSGNFFYLDQDSIQGKVSFQVIAKDESGNVCKHGQAYYFERKTENKRPLVLSLDQQDSAVHISWGNIGSSYKLYKSTGGGFKLLKFSKVNAVQDLVLANSTAISYYVKAFDERGILITSSEIKKL